MGFSNGCAELALKKPPPLVPSCLIASCDATGPRAMDLFFSGRLLGDRIAGSVFQRVTVGIQSWGCRR